MPFSLYILVSRIHWNTLPCRSFKHFNKMQRKQNSYQTKYRILITLQFSILAKLSREDIAWRKIFLCFTKWAPLWENRSSGFPTRSHTNIWQLSSNTIKYMYQSYLFFCSNENLIFHFRWLTQDKLNAFYWSFSEAKQLYGRPREWHHEITQPILSSKMKRKPLRTETKTIVKQHIK